MTIYPRLIYDNLWRKGGNALVSEPVADSQHPVSDTQIDTLSMFWKSSDETTTPTYVPMDLKAGTRSINFIAILGHNIDSDAVIIFQEDTVWNFPSPTPTPAFTWQAGNIFKFLATPLTEQFVRLKLTRDGGFTVKPQIATILCGSYSEFNRRPVKGHTPGRDDITEVEETDARVIFAQEKAILNVDRYIFAGLDNTTKDMILAFLKECGIHKAFVWCTDYIVANANSFWVRNSELISPVFQSPNFWNWEITMKEIV